MKKTLVMAITAVVMAVTAPSAFARVGGTIEEFKSEVAIPLNLEFHGETVPAYTDSIYKESELKKYTYTEKGLGGTTGIIIEITTDPNRRIIHERIMLMKGCKGKTYDSLFVDAVTDIEKVNSIMEHNKHSDVLILTILLGDYKSELRGLASSVRITAESGVTHCRERLKTLKNIHINPFKVEGRGVVIDISLKAAYQK